MMYNWSRSMAALAVLSPTGVCSGVHFTFVCGFFLSLGLGAGVIGFALLLLVSLGLVVGSVGFKLGLELLKEIANKAQGFHFLAGLVFWDFSRLKFFSPAFLVWQVGLYGGLD